jgi:hypothetical protein
LFDVPSTTTSRILPAGRPDFRWSGADDHANAGPMKKTLRLERHTLRALQSNDLAEPRGGVATDPTLTIVIKTLTETPLSRLSFIRLGGCCSETD